MQNVNQNTVKEMIKKVCDIEKDFKIKKIGFKNWAVYCKNEKLTCGCLMYARQFTKQEICRMFNASKEAQKYDINLIPDTRRTLKDIVKCAAFSAKNIYKNKCEFQLRLF